MRIAISGTQNSGKSTLVRAFLQKWPMFGTPVKTYRDVIEEHSLEHSSNTNEETQLLILDWMMKTQEMRILSTTDALGIISHTLSLQILMIRFQMKLQRLVSLWCAKA